MSDPTRRAATLRMLAAPVGLALIPAISAKEARNARVDGLNVTKVFTDTSQFVLGPMRRWTESPRDSDEALFSFIEAARDERSVFLSDESRGVRLQIDLMREVILYADDSAPQMRLLYPITSSSAVVDGKNVIFARVAKGRYLMIGPRSWVEHGDDGAQFAFTEEGRDAQSVFLHDAARGVRLQIDLSRQEVLYGEQGASDMRALYPIKAARAITP